MRTFLVLYGVAATTPYVNQSYRLGEIRRFGGARDTTSLAASRASRASA